MVGTLYVGPLGMGLLLINPWDTPDITWYLLGISAFSHHFPENDGWVVWLFCTIFFGKGGIHKLNNNKKPT